MSRWKGISQRFPRFSAYWIGALVIIALAIAIRVWLIKLGWPLLDSDEGTMGLMGIHIIRYHETPIFFYHQNYMGATEAYLAALMFHFFGTTSFTLRLGMIFLFTLFLIFMYLLTSLLFSKKWALITLLLLALGSDAILTRELVAVGGDAETLVSGTLILLLSTWLSLSVQDGTQRKRRLLAYAGWGLAAGFGIWSSLLVAPFILMGAIILLLFCRREIFNREVLKCFSWPGITLLVSFIIGALPLIIFNVQPQNFANNIFITFWNNHRGSGVPNISNVTQKPFYVLLAYQLRGAFQISLPTATDASPLCPVITRPDGIAVLQAHAISFSNPYALQCTLTHTIWPLGVVTLWIIATLLALYLLRPYWRRFIPSQWSPEEKPFVVRQVGRLSLLAVAGITFVLFALSPTAALFPVATSRYLIGLLVATPALLWPLWSGINAVKPLALQVAQVTVAVRLARISVFLRRGILLFIGISLVLGTINIFTGIFPTPPITANEDIYDTQVIYQHPNVPDTNTYNKDERGLITRLSVLKIRYIYADYWTCDRLSFQTREKVVCVAIQATDKSGRAYTKDTFCAGVQADNTPGMTNSPAAKKIGAVNRYPLYVKQVERFPEKTTFVLQENSTLANLMAQCVSTSHIVYNEFHSQGVATIPGYVIYQPTAQRR